MTKNVKIIYSIAVMFSLVICIGTHLTAETVSGTLTYTGTTSTGTFWVWASTAPINQEGSNPVALSSYTANGNNVNVNYTLVIPSNLLPRQLYIYAARDVNPPFVEEFLQNPQSRINPIYGDPFGELHGGVYLTLG
ncbi:MAG: hypothetical protein N2Z73_03595, partial [Endomicrobia bacterium]|nr:hypothetical protein [Endomicrobiia bacterium]